MPAALIALFMLVWLAVPFVGSAVAAHEGTLQITPETDSNPTGTNHAVVAAVTGGPVNSTVEIDFEIDCTTDCADASYTPAAPSAAGGPTSAPDAGVEGNQAAGQADDTRTTPELSCTATTDGAGAGSCTVNYTRNDVGSDEIIGWIDHDDSNTTDESDQTESQDETTGGGAGADTEPDDTDVSTKQWFGGLAANAKLDCDDANPGFDAAGDNETVEDVEVNQPGQAETYTCRVYNDANTNNIIDSGEPIAGVRLDAEIAGVNDPDNTGTGVQTADKDNACTTDSTGTCTFQHTPAEGEVGTSQVCVWTDEDNDNVYDNPSGQANDGGNCDTEGGPTAADDNDTTDIVQKDWANPAADVLDAEPELRSNSIGTQHTVTATVTDQFGNPVANVPVDFNVTGRNAGLKCDNQLTNANGVASCTYTDVGASDPIGPAPLHEDDVINVCVDDDADIGFDCSPDPADATPGEDGDGDLADQVEKFWFATAPTPATVQLDGDGDECVTFETFALNSVTDSHDFCALVKDSAGNPVPGAQVTFNATGPGNFVNSAGTSTGSSFTTTTDALGRAHATAESLQSGDMSVTAASSNVTSTAVTKRWSPGDARSIDCSPETASNAPGTEHTISCLVTDVFGNPVNNYGVRFIQTSGPGEFAFKSHIVFGVEKCPQGGYPAGQSGTPPPQYTGMPTCGDDTNAQGIATAIIETTANETGTTTVVAEMSEDFDGSNDNDQAGDNDDVCEEAVGQSSMGTEGQAAATTAGVCEDQVTKTWEAQPAPQCSDGVDNDGDGAIDFPADQGCDSAADDDETGPTEVDHVRTVNITRFKHIKLPGKKKPALMVKGTLSANPAFEDCVTGANVKVQIRASGEWITRKTDNANANGVWKVLIRDIPARYRAVAVPFDVSAAGGEIHHCLRDVDRARHTHGGFTAI